MRLNIPHYFLIMQQEIAQREHPCRANARNKNQHKKQQVLPFIISGRGKGKRHKQQWQPDNDRINKAGLIIRKNAIKQYDTEKQEQEQSSFIPEKLPAEGGEVIIQ